MNVSRGTSPRGWLWGAVVFAFLAGLLYFGYDLLKAQNTDLADIHEILGGLDKSLGKLGMVALFGAGAAICAGIGIMRWSQERRAFATPSTKSPRELTQALMLGLNFMEADLQANRRGELSSTQYEMLSRNYKTSSRWMLVGIIITLLMIGGVFVFVFFLSPGADLTWKSFRDNPTGLWIMGGVFGFILLILAASYLRMIMLNRPPDKLQIQQVEGQVRLTIRPMRYGTPRRVSSMMGGGTSICTLRVGRKTFYLNELQAEGFWNGGNYRLYYVRTNSIPTLLSAEVL